MSCLDDGYCHTSGSTALCPCVGCADANNTSDAGMPDAASSDAGTFDSGVLDSGSPDAGIIDAGTSDAGIDAGGPDSGVDAGADAGSDAGLSDAGTDGGCQPILATGSIASALQINPQHTGGQSGDTLSLPLCARWTTDLGGTPSYPVVAMNRVVLTVSVSSGGRTTARLVALEEHDGGAAWGPVTLGGTFGWSAVAYDNGRVFALNDSGSLFAFDAVTGATAWTTQMPGQSSFSSSPTASGGYVYIVGAGSGGSLYAVDEQNGTVVWTKTLVSGDESSPAVTSSGVYASFACDNAYGFPLSGDGGWFHSGNCSGGGGATVAVYDGGVYTRDSNGNLVLDTNTGATVGLHSSSFLPAFSGDMSFQTPLPNLQAFTLGSVTPLWTFGSSSVQAITAPIVVGSHVVVGASNGTLYVLYAADGGIAGSVGLANIRPFNETAVTTPPSSLAEADGMLFVPTATAVTAY